MARLAILEYPDPRLRTRAVPVTTFDARLKQRVADMFETMYAAPGIGLAASQVDWHERVIVIDRGVVRADDTLDAVVAGVARRRVTLRGVTADGVRDLDPDATVTTDPVDGVVTAVVSDSDALIRALVASGTPFRDLTVRGASLEEAFLTITKGAVV